MSDSASVCDREEPTVVVVEDDEDLLRALAFSLEVEGFRVVACTSAEDVLAAGAMPQRGCLILDYRLPAMNGLSLLEQLRSRGCALPAVIITTPTPAVLNLVEAAGAGLIEKPLLNRELIDRVRLLMQVG